MVAEAEGLLLTSPSATILSNCSFFGLGFCFGLRRAVPGKCAVQTFFKTDWRIKAEELARLRDIGLRIANVPVARWLILRLELLAGNFCEELERLVQGKTAAGSHVESLARNVGGFTSEEIGLHGVFDVGEVAGLLTVAKNDGLSAFQKRKAEFCQDA